ncbi:MAG: hypothetical protein IJ077_04900 [Eubacterium sp.]|nr:hypothetical protein [Eubacterium sp.]MBR2277702.1 hypothetical protein [Eubacterium sp.]
MSNDKSKNKKIIIIFAAVLVLCVAAAAVLLSRSSGDKTETTSVTQAQSTSETAAAPQSTKAETTTKKVPVGKTTEKALSGKTFVLLGMTVGTEGDYYAISFKDGKAELTEEFEGKKSTYKSDYKVKDDGVYTTLDSSQGSIDFKFEDTGKSKYIKYERTFTDLGSVDTDLAVIKADYDNESRFDIVNALDGKSFDSEYFARPLNITNAAKISFRKDAEYADDVLLATVDRFNGEYNINCKGINDSLLYCDMYVYNAGEPYGDGEPRRYKFCIEKTDGGYQQIVSDGNGTHFYKIEIK